MSSKTIAQTDLWKIQSSCGSERTVHQSSKPELVRNHFSYTSAGMVMKRPDPQPSLLIYLSPVTVQSQYMNQQHITMSITRHVEKGKR